MKTRIRQASTIGLVFLGSVVVAEFFLNAACWVSGRARWALAAPWERAERVWDPVLEYKGNPDHPEHDSLGFRNNDVPEQVDIVTTGDSQTYGYGVGRGKEWPQRLHEITGQSVYNLSMSGWGPVQYLAKIDQALGFRPRTLAVGLYLGNDLYDAYRQAYWSDIGRDLRDPKAEQLLKELEATKPLDVGLPDLEESDPTLNTEANVLRSSIASRSKLYALARGCYYLLRGSDLAFNIWTTEFRDDYWLRSKQVVTEYSDSMIAYEAEHARTVLYPHYRLPGVDLRDARIVEGVEVSLRALSSMHKRCIEEGTNLLVVVLPTKELTFAPFLSSTDEAEEAMQMSTRVSRLETEVRQRLFGFLAEKDISYVDVLPALRKTLADEIGNPYFESLNGHFSARGQFVIARAVAAHPSIR